LTLRDNDEVIKFVDRYEKESKAIKHELLKMCWYMRGGLTYDEAMNLSSSEKLIIGDIIKSNLEATKKSGMPFF